MTDNFYIYFIIALLPLTAIMSVVQVNPYHALVVRAILGAVASLVYVVLGSADVALTEALVGTMLAITLYVIAVRSSLVMRLGVITETKTEIDIYAQDLIKNLQEILKKYHLRLELVEYDNLTDLKQALNNQKIHGICTENVTQESQSDLKFDTIIRVKRLFTILKNELKLTSINLIFNDNYQDYDYQNNQVYKDPI